MYQEEIMAISIMCIVFVLPLFCGLIILFKNLCIDRINHVNTIQDTNNYSEI
jgi:hypothetical protein